MVMAEGDAQLKWFFNLKSKRKSMLSTQDFTGIITVKDKIIVLENGLFCLLVKTSSKNIDLLPIDDQLSYNELFGRVLDSIDFPLSIFIRPRQIDLKGYLALIERCYHETNNDSKRDFLQNYHQFFEELTEENNLVDRSKWLIIPWRSTSYNSVNYSWEEDYSLAKSILTDRAKGLRSFLERMDIESEVSSTEEIIRLLYNCYNFLYEEVQPWNPEIHYLKTSVISGASK